MRGERGQVTMFVILGIVILLVIGLFYLVLEGIRTEETIRDQTQDLIDTTKATTLSGQIANCLDTVVKDEFRILGDTGGFPAAEGFPSAIVGDQKTSRLMLYGVTANRDTAANGGLKPYMQDFWWSPDYPYPGIEIKDSLKDPISGKTYPPFVDGFFGDVNFPPICDPEGPNSEDSTRKCRFYPGQPPSTPKTKSTQELVRQQILQRVQACANIEEFEKTLGRDLNMVGHPDVELTFTHAGIIVEFDYPIEVNGQTQSIIETVRRTYEIRYLQVAQFAIDLARAESRDIYFNLERDYTTLPSYRTGFFVMRNDVRVDPQKFPSMDPKLGKHATLVTIVDSESDIDGAGFTFSFLIEKRRPMMGLIENRIGCTPLAQMPLQKLLDEASIGAEDPDDTKVNIMFCRGNSAVWHAATNKPSCPEKRTIMAVDADGQIDYEITECEPFD
ncbi:hypothetical protein GOV11_01900 [Candidatus Woesearchaeota archaeon]|nr:hypothetical protein [Candidatus Woesearchaeota archaeon]